MEPDFSTGWEVRGGCYVAAYDQEGAAGVLPLWFLGEELACGFKFAEAWPGGALRGIAELIDGAHAVGE